MLSSFSLLFLGALIAASAYFAYRKSKQYGIPLFALTFATAALSVIGGDGAVSTIAVLVVIFAAAIGMSYTFREFLVQVLPREMAKALRTAPLTACFGLFTILVYALVAIFAPVIAPFGESEVVGTSFNPATNEMILGGDQLGRDMFTRIVYGARNTVGIALMITAIAFTIGTILGLLAATLGGWVDQALGRVVDVLMAIPQLIFALLLLTIFGTSVLSLTLVIALLYSPLVFRLARAVAGNIVVMDYIEAAKLRGEKLGYLMFKEILPNATAPLLAEFGLRFCFVFLTIAALSFLGIGIQPPLADWGSMVSELRQFISFAQWDILSASLPLMAAGAIALLTVAVNFVVDWMLHRSSGLKE